MATPEQLQTVPLDIGATSHEKLDQPILDMLDCMGLNNVPPDQLEISQLTMILSFLVISSNSLLDDRYCNPQLLQGRSDIQEAIRKAFKERSFANIRNLTILWSPQAVALAPRQIKSSLNQFADLQKSFIRPYHGAAVDGFYEYLTKCNNKFSTSSPSPYYAKFCSIVQSSGTGKSRLMTECCAFFTALFATLRNDLKSLATPSYFNQAVNQWTESMCDMASSSRRKFFSKVDVKYKELLSSIKEQMVRSESELLVEDATDKMKGLNLADEPSGPNKAPMLAGGPAMIQEYKNMIHDLQDLLVGSKHHPKLVIAFDEAHPLILEQAHFRPAHILCRVINAYSRHSREDVPVWVVFASTTSKVANFQHPRSYVSAQSPSVSLSDDSLRVAEGGQLLFPPYTLLGWDQNANRVYDITPNSVAKFDHIIGFGRPLKWKGAVLAGSLPPLPSSSRYGSSFGRSLSQRFGLDICPGHPESVSYLEKGITSHLRICLGTTEDQMRKYTSYPSEPFLSCVAANLLHANGALRSVLGILADKVDSGMFKIGQNGELASRLLWLLAKDRYVRDKVHPGVTKVPTAAEEAFQNAYINFSHWVSMKEDFSPLENAKNVADIESPYCANLTLRHWLRTSAVQCYHRQPDIDKMIPIFFDTQKDGDDENHISHLFISDNAGQKSSKRILNSIQRHKLLTKSDPKSNLPYIAVVLDLGVENESFKLTATYPEPDKSQTNDYCLRVYATGRDLLSAPFLNECPDMANVLKHLVMRHHSLGYEEPFAKHLQDQMAFGSTSLERHMRWEAGKDGLQLK
ncbi:hypothetical protein BJ138DRAFT_1102282 [Hygrophoropsis aurantiaca]|uniref:Uncharacterized protein n=1 Tax=Hygrophoropsis aurantiaca TaxID=72124 RepID=A0ACB8A8W6_9AGAM|nr:hypothetical protein BJ138DRAFT_1102282 [Hygrophoropsis aurantiaca]